MYVFKVSPDGQVAWRAEVPDGAESIGVGHYSDKDEGMITRVDWTAKTYRRQTWLEDRPFPVLWYRPSDLVWEKSREGTDYLIPPCTSSLLLYESE